MGHRGAQCENHLLCLKIKKLRKSRGSKTYLRSRGLLMADQSLAFSDRALLYSMYLCPVALEWALPSPDNYLKLPGWAKRSMRKKYHVLPGKTAFVGNGGSAKIQFHNIQTWLAKGMTSRGSTASIWALSYTILDRTMARAHHHWGPRGPWRWYYREERAQRVLGPSVGGEYAGTMSSISRLLPPVKVLPDKIERCISLIRRNLSFSVHAGRYDGFKSVNI